MGGVILSCLLAVAEFMWEARKIVKDKEVRYHKHPSPGVGKTVQRVLQFFHCQHTLLHFHLFHFSYCSNLLGKNSQLK